jgi:imidazolonepropionase-like amidohydrolase
MTMASSTGRVRLRAARAFLDGRMHSGGIMLDIVDGVITEIGRGVASVPGIDEIDLGDRTLLPGLIDAHTHFLGISTDHYDSLLWERLDYRAARAAGEAYRLLLSGFTSVRCLGSPVSLSLSRAIREGHLIGPRILSAGQSLCATNGTWDIVHADRRVADLQEMLVDGVDSLRLAVRERIRGGAQVIKVGLSRGHVTDHAHGWGDDPTRTEVTYSQAELDTIVAEAHGAGLKVSAHAIGDAPVRAAVQAGIDIIEHGFGIDDDTRAMLASARIPIVTTFTGLALSRDQNARQGTDPVGTAIQTSHLERMRTDFAAGRAAGIVYALGSDLIGDPAQPQTAAVEEFVTASAWGMTPTEALLAGTAVAAELLGIANDVGSIRVGARADLVACRADPTQSIAALREIDFVMSDGIIRRND